MRDHLRRDRAIHAVLLQGYSGQLRGTRVRHVTTLAARISGIVGSPSPQVPTRAARLPEGTHPESRVKRCARWLKHARSTPEVSWVPSAKLLLAPLAFQTLGLVVDGSVVGRGSVALLRHVVSHGRARPVAWLVRSGKTGHCPEDRHLALVEQGHDRLPSGARVVVLGDGAWDGTRRQATRHTSHGSDVVRTSRHVTVPWHGEPCRCETMGACSQPGTLVALREAHVTRDASGPVLRWCCWAKDDQESLS